ncbi:MAG: hypothetical protein JWP60_2060 [Ramlibacter sp.]|nr:hypothetical protein [Ramlibacter sp.]
MDWKAAVVRDDGTVKLPKRWLHLHYYEALNILFRFENSLRVFVYAILKNEFGARWLECVCKSPASSESVTLKNVAARRATQAESFGYLGFDIKAAMMHLTSGELVELITADAYWPKFKPYFKASREIVKSKLLEIGTIRNSLAHFRPMPAADVEVIKQNSRHTLLEVEKCLHHLFTQNLRVPTNSPKSWYAALATLGTAQISTTLYYSNDENWVCAMLTFNSPMLSKQKITETFHSYNVAKINGPNVLLTFPKLRSHVTCLSEYQYPAAVDAEWNLTLQRALYFVFREDVLTINTAEIEGELKQVAQKISEECELLQQDHLARGSLVQAASGYSWWETREATPAGWRHSYGELEPTYDPSHPDEYWGERQFTGDVIAGIRRFPWMPEDVSSSEVFGD